MTTEEVLAQSQSFTEELVKQLSDKGTELSKKQVYFMDNHPKIQACMQALRQVVDSVKNSEEAVSAEDLETMNNAQAILSVLQKTITSFQQELMITENVQEDDLVPTQGLTTENIAAAAQNNETTKSIVKDMGDIIKNQQSAVGYTHCLVCDGKMNMFAASSKDEVNKYINNIAAAGNYKDIQLYKISFTPVPMKKKTILSV